MWAYHAVVEILILSFIILMAVVALITLYLEVDNVCNPKDR